jgi:type IV pilus assembly protein PilA
MRSIVKKLNIGFSLVELMTIVLIFAILVAIAIPAYRDYLVRSKLVDVMTILEAHLKEAQKEYINTGSTPTSVLNIPNQTFTAYTNSKYIDYIYYDDGSTWTNKGAAMVQAVLSSNIGGAISGYTVGTAGTNNRLTIAFLASGEVMHIYCGSWVDDGTQVPAKYLPDACKDDAFETTVTG